MSKEFERFHIVDQRGRELTRLNADVMLYINVPLREIRDEVIDIMELFYQLCPREAIGWYATETMKQFKPTTSRSFTLPAVWWKDGCARKNLRELMLKGGEAHDSVGTCGIYLSSAEREHIIFKLSSNYLRFMVPADFMETGSQTFVDFVITVCNRIPFVSGHGGFVIECNQYFAEDAQGAAFPLAMRYQAVDIATRSRGPGAVQGERIKNVGWLTLIGSELLEKIGGLNPLQRNASDRLSLVQTAHGVLIRAGQKPILGDVNRREDLSAFVDAYRLVEPLHNGIKELFAPFKLAGDADEVDATQRWLFRFLKKGV
ncbi:MAG: type VI immunity family protein [Bdellovibrionota bacterium]